MPHGVRCVSGTLCKSWNPLPSSTASSVAPYRRTGRPLYFSGPSGENVAIIACADKCCSDSLRRIRSIPRPASFHHASISSHFQSSRFECLPVLGWAGRKLALDAMRIRRRNRSDRHAVQWLLRKGARGCSLVSRTPCGSCCDIYRVGGWLWPMC